MNKIVYHGSPNGNIEIIKAQLGTHQKKCIYATDNKIIAMLFMNRGMGDLDTIKEYDNGLPILIERRQGVLEKIYNTSGYIYELDGSSFKHYDYLWEPEVISFESAIKPIKKTYYDNILMTLNEEAKSGNLKIYKYPNRPNYIPLDNSDLIDKYINFKLNGIKGAVNTLLTIYPEFESIVTEKLNKNENKVK